MRFLQFDLNYINNDGNPNIAQDIANIFKLQDGEDVYLWSDDEDQLGEGLMGLGKIHHHPTNPWNTKWSVEIKKVLPVFFSEQISAFSDVFSEGYSWGEYHVGRTVAANLFRKGYPLEEVKDILSYSNILDEDLRKLKSLIDADNR